MSEISRILDQFRRAFNGDAWLGEPVLQIVNGISAHKAFQHPIPGAHSIWEIVLHITAWEGEALRRLQTGILQMPEEGDWNVVEDPSAEAWAKTLERFILVHNMLDAAIASLSDGDLLRTLGGTRKRELGSGVSIYVLLHGIIQHSLYHAGQIALLKKM